MDPYNNLRSYGEALIESIDPARAEAVAVRALAAPSVGLSFRRRLVAIAAASATFITGNLGVAMAADQAAPGDLLFGLDRAYEQLSELIGFSDDHTVERLDEAAQLADAGNREDALDAVIQQLQALSDGQADKADQDIDASGLDTAIAAISAARDRTHEVGNETAAVATSDAKQIVTQAHAIAAALQSGDRANAREALKNLLDTLKAERGQGNAFGREQNKGQGLPPSDPGNGGGQGNSGQTP
jgi:hypothetical protein